MNLPIYLVQNMNKEYIASEYRRMHKAGLFSGGSLMQHIPELKALVKEYDIKTILDYGCGKAACHKMPLAESVYLYDPYCYPYDIKPKGTFDLVICTDVLEHVPEDEIGKTLVELINYTDKVLYLSIATYPAEKKFTNGENVHITIKPKEWWEQMLSTAKDIKIVRHYS